MFVISQASLLRTFGQSLLIFLGLEAALGFARVKLFEVKGFANRRSPFKGSFRCGFVQRWLLVPEMQRLAKTRDPPQ